MNTLSGSFFVCSQGCFACSSMDVCAWTSSKACHVVFKFNKKMNGLLNRRITWQQLQDPGNWTPVVKHQ